MSVKSIFEYDGHVIVLSEVSLVVKNDYSDEYKKLYPTSSEYSVYFKNSSTSMGIKEKDIERFKTALREYYDEVERGFKYDSPAIKLFPDGTIGYSRMSME